MVKSSVKPASVAKAPAAASSMQNMALPVAIVIIAIGAVWYLSNQNATGGGGSCTPNWQCTDWSACAQGTQSRTCTDSKNCSVTTGKPTGTQTCSGTPTVGCGNNVCEASENSLTCASDCGSVKSIDQVRLAVSNSLKQNSNWTQPGNPSQDSGDADQCSPAFPASSGGCTVYNYIQADNGLGNHNGGLQALVYQFYNTLAPKTLAIQGTVKTVNGFSVVTRKVSNDAQYFVPCADKYWVLLSTLGYEDYATLDAITNALTLACKA